MTDPLTGWPLPNERSWSFEDILAAEPSRAAKLERAGSPQALVDALTEALERAIGSGDLALGWEFAESCPSDHRAVVQFRVDQVLFDWFFNARSGYRAHFRAHPENGLSFNSVVIVAMHALLRELLPASQRMQILDSGMNSRGDITVVREDFLHSIDSNLGKLWLGSQPLGGGTIRPFGITPRLRVDDMTWGAPYMDDAWLDIKGAFARDGRLYQMKCPRKRALRLHKTGEA
jgi:hypothetical protein